MKSGFEEFCYDVSAVEQFVGRERRERVSQLDSAGGGRFDARRRVNSDVGSHRNSV